jgi:aryl-alcohol dehydrogenase-like predicted oxidoreductase
MADRHHLHRPIVEQPEYNLFHRQRVEAEYSPLYRDFGLGLTTWSPLDSGILTGKYRDGIPEGSRGSITRLAFMKEKVADKSKHAAVAALEPIARELDCTLAQLALAWCLKNPNVSSVITGASRVSQVEENMKAVGVVSRLGDEVMRRIDAATRAYAE